jgi:ABC-type bacteriocin/lantibiotic exporter with double-glycine peptidase domain
MYYSFFPPLTNTVKECFENKTSPGLGLIAALALIVLVVVQLFVVQFLWNTVLVSAVTCVKPLKSLLYTFGLLVLVAMIFP